VREENPLVVAANAAVQPPIGTEEAISQVTQGSSRFTSVTSVVQSARLEFSALVRLGPQHASVGEAASSLSNQALQNTRLIKDVARVPADLLARKWRFWWETLGVYGPHQIRPAVAAGGSSPSKHAKSLMFLHGSWHPLSDTITAGSARPA
jgi:hypothetical protein